MKVRHLLIIALFLGGCIFPSAFSTLQAAAPDWLSDAWRTTFYPSSTYFTGFAVYQKSKETKADALRKAEEAARVDAAATIRVKIANETNYNTSESSTLNSRLYTLNLSDEEFVSKTTSSVDLNLSGMQVVSYMEGKQAYAFAYLAKDDLRRQLTRSIDANLTNVEAKVDVIDALLRSNQIEVAKKTLRSFGQTCRSIRQDQQLLIAIDTTTNLSAVQLERSNDLQQRLVTLLPDWQAILHPQPTIPDTTIALHHPQDTILQPTTGNSRTTPQSTYSYSGNTIEYTDNAKALTTLAEAISKWEKCKTGTITEKGTGVAIYGSNGWQTMGMYSEAEKELANKLENINENRYTILDVCMTSDNRWCIVYSKQEGHTSASWYNAPNGAGDKLKQFFADGDLLRSVSFTDKDYVIITDKHYTASNDWDKERLDKAHELYGSILSVCTTSKGIIVVCQRGVYYDRIPEKVAYKIRSFIEKYGAIQFVKFTDSGTCLITSKDESYMYYM